MALVPFPGPQSGAYPVPPDEDDDTPAAGKMSFLEHLDELRKRIVYSVIAIAVCVVLGFAFINRIVDFILAPTRGALPPGVKLIYTQPGEAFSLYVQIALIMGVVLAAEALAASFAALDASKVDRVSSRRISSSRVLFSSFDAFLNSARLFPSERPSSGSLRGPKMIRAITKMMISSGMPIEPNIGFLLSGKPRRDDSRHYRNQVQAGQGVPARYIPRSRCP
jgi:hypothetical protein